jgi:hypothetical protein
MFTPERIAIEKLDGTVVAGRQVPRDSFAGHQMSALGRASSSLFQWIMLCGLISPHPFFSQMDGVRVEQTQAWREGAETWHVLRVYFPGSIETHSRIQDFFFGENLMLRRHD